MEVICPIQLQTGLVPHRRGLPANGQAYPVLVSADFLTSLLQLRPCTRS